jgi:NADH:ubiquinone oxidoreductase subunit 6 (subunit J)
MGMQIAFWALALIIIAGALSVVLLRNVFRAGLALIVSLIGIAGIFITLSADFLAIVQVLIYVGGISVLVLLSILLTRNLPQGSPANKMRLPAFLVAALFLGVVIYSIINTSFPISSSAPLEPTTANIGLLLIDQNGWVFPLEIAGVLLLAAILGAVVMAREK